MKALNLRIHEPLSADLTQRLLERFYECKSNFNILERRDGDERIFYFEKYISKTDADFLFDRHLEYCDSIRIAKPSYLTLMINRTWYHPSGLGSGAGWHRDSGFKSQHKTFSYLSDVCKDNGPFVVSDHSNFWLSLFDNPRIRQKQDLKFSIKSKDLIYKEFIGSQGYSFSLCTNFIHRGLPVLSGERFMVTVYAWNELPGEPFRSYFR